MGEGLNWQIIGVLVSLVSLISGVLVMAVKFLLDRTSRHIDRQFNNVEKRFEHIEKLHEQEAKEVERIDKELLKFRAELPQQYVMRADWIRFSNVIDAKQDQINAKFEQLLVQLGERRHGE